jgi:hypothetical protein
MWGAAIVRIGITAVETNTLLRRGSAILAGASIELRLVDLLESLPEQFGRLSNWYLENLAAADIVTSERLPTEEGQRD